MTLVPEVWMLMGMETAVGWVVAEKLRLSIASPWALPVGSGICHTSHSAAPGGQAGIGCSVTPRLTWLFGAVPSTGTPPTSAGAGARFTFRTGRNAVGVVGKGAELEGSME